MIMICETHEEYVILSYDRAVSALIRRLPRGWYKHSDGLDTGVHDDGRYQFMQNMQDNRPNIMCVTDWLHMQNIKGMTICSDFESLMRSTPLDSQPISEPLQSLEWLRYGLSENRPYDLIGSSDRGTEMFRFLRKQRFCTHFWWQTNRRTDGHLIAYCSRPVICDKDFIKVVE